VKPEGDDDMQEHENADSDLMGGVTKEFIISPIGKKHVVIIVI
jgi:hypothetical protein